MEQTKRDYLRGKEILEKVTDGDDFSIEAIALRTVWTPEDIIKLQKYLDSLEDQGIQLTLTRAD